MGPRAALVPPRGHAHPSAASKFDFPGMSQKMKCLNKPIERNDMSPVARVYMLTNLR